MDRTACTEPQCLYKGDLYPFFTQISNFMKIRPVAAELFHVDGQTDMTKLVTTSSSPTYSNSLSGLLVIF